MASRSTSTQKKPKRQEPKSLDQVHEEIQSHPKYHDLPEEKRWGYSAIVGGFTRKDEEHEEYARDVWRMLFNQNQ